MRSSRRTLILICVLAALLLPAVAYAAGPFYTTTDSKASATGDGSVGDPRKATTLGELDAACKAFANDLGSDETATVYWYDVDNNGYCRFKLKKDGSCIPDGCFAGEPPGTGVDVPPPLIVGGLIALGIVLLSAAWLLRRRGLRPA